jgi:hypothetical protein
MAKIKWSRDRLACEPEGGWHENSQTRAAAERKPVEEKTRRAPQGSARARTVAEGRPMTEQTKQIVLTAHELAAKRCPACGASIEVISGHWLLRDCALCAWCRRWFALPAPPAEPEILKRVPGEVRVRPGVKKGN